MPSSLSADQFASLLRPGHRVFVPGCSGQSLLLDDWLRSNAAACAGVTFCGVLIPGINRTDYAALHPDARMEVIFLPPDFRASYNRGQVDYLPLPYCNTYQYYQQGPRFDLALIQVSPPNAQGQCSFGLSADFSPAAIDNAACIVAHINPNMPFTQGPTINVDSIDYCVEQAAPLLEIHDEGEVPADVVAVARQIVTHIHDGDTLQFGLGKMQRGILEQLRQHRNLRVHSGMVSDPLLLLAGSGSLADEPGSVTCGVALGTQPLYDFCTHDPRVTFAPVGYTHQTRTLQDIEHLICINSCIEIDLLGQANGETIKGQQISGTGGLVDFGRGARLAKGGKYILATPATAKNGTISRIVPRLGDQQLVSVTRQDIDLVITEYGTADLRYKSVHQRAEALIAIAAPQFREQLAAAWHDSMKHEL